MNFSRYISLLLVFIGSLVNEIGATEDRRLVRIDSLRHELKKQPENIDVLYQLGMLSLNMKQTEAAREYGSKLLLLSQRKDHEGRAATYGNTILGHVALMKNENIKGYEYLNNARRLAELRRDSATLASIFNGIAIYKYYCLSDIPDVITYYYKGMAAAKAAGAIPRYYTIMNNLANAYIEMNDSVGLKYSRECYDYAKKHDDHWLMYTSSLSQADMYYTLGKYVEALKHISTAEKALPYLSDLTPHELYLVKGKLMAAIGNHSMAREYYKKARDSSAGLTSAHLTALNSSAEFEISHGNYVLAQTYLDTVVSHDEDMSSAHSRIKALQLYSTLEEKQGNLAKSLALIKEYMQLKESSQKMASLLQMNDVQVKFEFDELSNQLTQEKINNMRHQRKYYILLGVAVLLLTCSGFLYYLRIKQTRLHKAVVEQMRVSLQTEDTLRKRISDMEEAMTGGSSAKPQDEEKSDSDPNQVFEILIDKIDHLLESQKVYKDPNLTRDAIADMLDTNPKYVTRAISLRYNMTFTQFINNYRIREAIRILSDSEDDTPLKVLGEEVGYKSATSFYHHFKEATGMTPAAYRQASGN